jgi:hypothetical protein
VLSGQQFPAGSPRSNSQRESLAGPDDRRGGLAFGLLAAASLVVMACISFDYGITWDEPIQDRYGELVYRYFRSGFTDRSALNFVNLYLYGGLFEALCAIAEKVSPFTRYDTRHLLNSIVGWLGMVYAARIGGLLMGPRAAFLTLLLLLLSPHYFGHCMNNSKDVPFATGYVASLYYLLRIDGRYPFMTPALSAKIALAIASAIAVRFGGLLLIVYLWLLIAVLTAASGRWRPADVLAMIVRTGLVSVAALLLGTLFCPWALQQPFVRPFQALRALSQFPAERFRVLFDGQSLSAAHLPSSYLPTMFAITTPITILLLALASPTAVGAMRPADRFRYLLLWLALLFPPLYVILTHAPVYDGLRHLLFIYPLLVILAGIAAEFLVRWVSGQPRRRWFALAAIVVGLWDPLRFSLLNHPNQIAYFNGLVGGVPGAFQRYDIDYMGNSAKQALEWLLKEGRPPGQSIRVSGPKRNAFTRAMPHYLGEYDRFIFVGWNDPPQADFDVEVLLGGPATLRKSLRKGRIVHVIAADGVPLCVIRAGRRVEGALSDGVRESVKERNRRSQLFDEPSTDRKKPLEKLLRVTERKAEEHPEQRHAEERERAGAGAVRRVRSQGLAACGGQPAEDALTVDLMPGEQRSVAEPPDCQRRGVPVPQPAGDHRGHCARRGDEQRAAAEPWILRKFRR